MTYRALKESWEKSACEEAAEYLRTAPVSIGDQQYFFTQNEALAVVGHCFSIFRNRLPEKE